MFAIPASRAASERANSMAQMVLGERRGNLASGRLEALIMLKFKFHSENA